MLLYHFTSRDGLLTAVTLAVEQRELTAFLHQVQQSGIDLAAFWQRISNARLRSQERLFFELYVHALVHRDEGNFAAHAVNDWLEPIAAQLAELGVPQAHAEVHARLGLAVVRGLLLDLLATRDLVGTTKAFELYMRSTAASFLTERAS